MKPLRLLFLHPKTLTDSWPCPVDVLGEVIKVPSLVYPLLSATLGDLPVQVEIFDGYVTRETFRDYKARLARADLVAITVMTPLKAMDTELTLRLLKRLNPCARVILGGNHASAFPERWVEKGADYVIVKEGEVAFRQLMERLVAGEGVAEVPNLVYRGAEGAPAHTGLQAASIALDESPLPAWERMSLAPYHAGLRPGGGLTATVELSRGCPHRCDFCNINMFWGYKQRYKSVERVVAELERLHRLGVRQLFLSDDNFGHDYRHTHALLEEMVRREFGFTFGAFVRGDTVARHAEFAPLAARAGLRLALMGIESLDKQWLREHRKGVGATDVLGFYSSVYTTLRSHGVFLLGLFITPPEAEPGFRSGRGVDGVVCDYHYSADLLAQRGSALYERHSAAGEVVKDMFYHDWNLPSLQLNGRVQGNRKSFVDTLKEIDLYNLLGLVSPDYVGRRFRWRNVGVLAERLLCTQPGDLERYRIAKDDSLPPEERQRRIVESIVNEDMVERLVRAEQWRAPLALRCGW